MRTEPEDGNGSRRPPKGVRRCGKCRPARFLFIQKKIRLHLFCCFKQQILCRQFTNGFARMRGALFKRFTLPTYATSSGYASSAGSAPGGAALTYAVGQSGAAQQNNMVSAIIVYANGLKIAWGTWSMAVQTQRTVSIPYSFSHYYTTGNNIIAQTANTIMFRNGNDAGTVYFYRIGY